MTTDKATMREAAYRRGVEDAARIADRSFDYADRSTEFSRGMQSGADKIAGRIRNLQTPDDLRALPDPAPDGDWNRAIEAGDFVLVPRNMITAMMSAGQQYLDSKTLDPIIGFDLPATFRWTEFWDALLAASPTARRGERDDILWQTARDVTKLTDCWIDRGGEDAVAEAVYDALTKVQAEAARGERELIVAWLRKGANFTLWTGHLISENIADAIEAGAHLPAPDQPAKEPG